MPEKKEYVPREGRLVNDWLKEFHPNALTWKRVRLGPLPDTPEAAIYSTLRRWADIVFLENGVVNIVEAKMRPHPGALSQLELYKTLFPKTPEYSQLWDKPVKMIYLTTVVDEAVKTLSEAKGIEYIVFAPEWTKGYWEEMIAKH